MRRLNRRGFLKAFAAACGAAVVVPLPFPAPPPPAPVVQLFWSELNPIEVKEWGLRVSLSSEILESHAAVTRLLHERVSRGIARARMMELDALLCGLA